MSATLSKIRQFLSAWPQAAVAEIIEAKGSTPREVATWMLVSPQTIFGTIGGGRLEFMAIDRAREMIAQGIATDRLDVPLGPEIGQCCGGRVKIDLTLADEALRAEMAERTARADALQPHVYLFGGGHVGRALAEALALLPLKVTVVETRADAVGDLPESVEVELTAVPEEAVRAAPAGSVFIVLTHDHALDFLIVAEALARGDAAYVGMIGSRTKRVTFRSWYLREAGGSEEAAARLVCPIGGADVKDKRPAVIAALVAAEVMRGLAG